MGRYSTPAGETPAFPETRTTLCPYNPSMPIYEYECRQCKAHTEAFQKISDKPRVKCPKSGGRLEKRNSAPAIQFKGSGWDVNDSAGKATQGDTSESEANT